MIWTKQSMGVCGGWPEKQMLEEPATEENEKLVSRRPQRLWKKAMQRREMIVRVDVGWKLFL